MPKTDVKVSRHTPTRRGGCGNCRGSFLKTDGRKLRVLFPIRFFFFLGESVNSLLKNGLEQQN